MINYKIGKDVYSTWLGQLYIDRSKINSHRPVIYIGGQMEHRLQVLKRLGFTNDYGHNAFSGSWFHNYPISGVDKGSINARNMADNLLKAIRSSGLEEVDLVTQSFGGLVGAYASKDDLVKNVYSIHPTFLGSPLANPDLLEQYKDCFDYYELMVLKILKKIIDPNYGFQKDNFVGLDLDYVDLSKVLLIGSYIDPTLERDKNILTLYSIIMKVYNLKSDGIAIFDEKLFDDLGIKFMYDGGYNHLECIHEDYLNSFKRVMKL